MVAKARHVGGWVLLGAALGAGATSLYLSAPPGVEHAPLPPSPLPAPAPSRQPEAQSTAPTPPLALREREPQPAAQSDNIERPPLPRDPLPKPKSSQPRSDKLPAPPPLLVPPTIPKLEYLDMPNGYVFHTALGEGHGRLKIANGTRSHAVAKLVDPIQERSVHTVLIRSDQEVTVAAIPDGSYRLLFALGKGWNQEQQRFYEPHSFAEFQRRLVYTTTERERGGAIYEYSSVIDVTLHPVVGGTARTTGISEAEFARY